MERNEKREGGRRGEEGNLLEERRKPLPLEISSKLKPIAMLSLSLSLFTTQLNKEMILLIALARFEIGDFLFLCCKFLFPFLWFQLQ
jgi:hypothetical protein